MRRFPCLTLMLAATLAGPLAARSVTAQAPPRGDAVPRELAEAILRQASGGSTRIGSELFVGELPSGLTAPLDLRGGNVVGGFTLHGQATALLATKASPEDAIADVARQLQAAGWKAAPLPPAGKGFQEALSASPHLFCSGNNTITVRAFGSELGGSNVLVTQARVPSEACESSMASVARATPIELPTLVDPSVAGPMSTCFPSNRASGAFVATLGGVMSNGTSTILRTSLAPDSVLLHYARQLEDSGWVRIPQNSVRGQWSRPDSAGLTRTLTLTVEPTPLARGCYSVNMNILRAPTAR